VGEGLLFGKTVVDEPTTL